MRIVAAACLLAWLTVPALQACTTGATSSSACRYEPLAISAAAPRQFVGRAGPLEVRLSAERDGSDVASFPDSALAIRLAGGSHGCEAEGGVWQRNGVYATADGHTVAAIESSGSNDVLVFFDSSSCRRVGEIDVSDARWEFRGAQVVVTPVGSPARPPRIHALGAACRPK